MKICEPTDRAFPTQRPFELRDKDGELTAVEHHWGGGLTKREYFAAIVLQGLSGFTRHRETGRIMMPSREFLAHEAVEIADALIDELNNEGSKV